MIEIVVSPFSGLAASHCDRPLQEICMDFADGQFRNDEFSMQLWLLSFLPCRTRKLPFFLRDWKMFCRCHSGKQLAASDLYWNFPIFSVTFIIFYSLAVWQNWVSTSTTKDSTLFWSWWPSACLRREAFPWWGILGTKFVSFAPGCKALFLANGQGKTFGPHAEMRWAWVVFSVLVG